MKVWLKQTLPPWQYMAIFLLLLAGTESFRLFIILSEGLDADSVPREIARGWYGHQLIIAGAATGYSLWRASAFSPISNRPYRRWLSTTPWTSKAKLPMGPWHLGGQDAVVLAFMCLLSLYGGWHMVWIPMLSMIIFHAISLAILQWYFRLRVHACLNGMLMLALVLLWDKHTLFYATLFAVWASTTWGVRRLTRILDEDPDRVEAVVPLSPPSMQQDQMDLLQWPLDALLLVLPNTKNRPVNCVALAVLVAFTWYVLHYCAALAPPEFADAESLQYALHLGYSIAIFLLALFRWRIYQVYAKAPISVLGRIRYGLLLMPRSDVVLAAPIAILVVGFGGRHIAGLAGWPPIVWSPLLIAACILIATLAGPSLNAWRLTGGHVLTHVLALRKLPGMRI